MALIEQIDLGPDEGQGWIFFCPACEEHHQINGRWRIFPTAPGPTIRPSYRDSKCHLLVTGGTLYYLKDSSHRFAGQSLKMIDLEDV